jgi:hypothetical protein
MLSLSQESSGLTGLQLDENNTSENSKAHGNSSSILSVRDESSVKRKNLVNLKICKQ